MKALLLAGVASVVSSAAMAQSAPAPAPAPDTSTVGEVVVTAEHRAIRMQDTPITITAVTAQQMAVRGVVDPLDLGKITPSFVSGYVGGFGTPFMRGVGSTNVTAGDENSVATYVDGFYEGIGITAHMPFNNVQQIEILKGPQGTLYGRNATGGLISITTRTPRDEFSADGYVGYGNYNTFQAAGYVTGPLTKSIDADLAFTVQNQGTGFDKNVATGGTNGRNDYYAFRSKILFNLGDGNTFTLGASYANSRDNTVTAVQPFPGTLPLVTGPGIAYSTAPHTFSATTPPIFFSTEVGVNGTLKLDAGFANFVSLTQWRRITLVNGVSGTANNANNILGPVNQYTQDPAAVGRCAPATGTANCIPSAVVPASFWYLDRETMPFFFTQEFQLISKPGGPLKWQTGLFYQQDEDAYLPGLFIFYNTAAPAIATIQTYQITTAYAGYAEGTYSFDNGLSLTTGVRLSTERHHKAGDLYGAPATTQDASFSAFTYHAAAQYRLNPQLMVFLSTSKGFKSGLFDTSADSNPVVKPETLYSYEGGFKSDPTSRIRFNGSVYYYDFRDLQTFVNEANTGLSVLENAGGAQMYGAEFELEVIPVHNLTLSGSLGLEHSEYTNTPNASVFFPSPSGGDYSTAVSVTGNQLVRTPAVTGNLSAVYRIDMANGGHITLNGAVDYTGKFYWDENNITPQKAYALLDLSAQYTSPDGRWTLTLWGKNVTDTIYSPYRNVQQRYDGGAFGDPATFGVKAGFKY